MILGSGQTLFKDIEEKVGLKLLNSKTFGCGMVMLHCALAKRGG